MSVYVDRLFTMTPRTAQARRHGDGWCHMWGDTEDELHKLAARIGLRREWFQPAPAFNYGVGHYDLVPGKREAALRTGAVERSLRAWFTERRARLDAATKETP